MVYFLPLCSTCFAKRLVILWELLWNHVESYTVTECGNLVVRGREDECGVKYSRRWVIGDDPEVWDGTVTIMNEILMVVGAQRANNYVVIFLGSFVIWGNDVTSAHLSRGFTLINTCPTKYFNGRCFKYVAFECHANFRIDWESFAHRDQPKKKKHV